MMGGSLRKLLSISSRPLSTALRTVEPEARMLLNRHEELDQLLDSRNGFFAFEGALRVFPKESVPLSYGLVEWNRAGLWTQEYQGFVEECLFFAEDIFGGQFCLREGGVSALDPETGELSYVAANLEQWASDLLANYEIMTGYRIAHEWQERNGVLPGRSRLVPTIPFVCGGDFALSNLVAVDAARGMVARATLARKIRDLPDGSQICFRIDL